MPELTYPNAVDTKCKPWYLIVFPFRRDSYNCAPMIMSISAGWLKLGSANLTFGKSTGFSKLTAGSGRVSFPWTTVAEVFINKSFTWSTIVLLPMEDICAVPATVNWELDRSRFSPSLDRQLLVMRLIWEPESSNARHLSDIPCLSKTFTIAVWSKTCSLFVVIVTCGSCSTVDTSLWYVNAYLKDYQCSPCDKTGSRSPSQSLARSWWTRRALSALASWFRI